MSQTDFIAIAGAATTAGLIVTALTSFWSADSDAAGPLDTLFGLDD